MLGESGFLNYSRKLGFEAVVVRYHNVYGPRMGFKHVIPHLAQRFSDEETPFKIYGHDQTRAFNYIDDAVNGTVLAMNCGDNHEIYHIGDTDEISIEQLVHYVGEMFDYGGAYENAPTFGGSVGRRCPDISKATRDLGYSPSVHWRDGVAKTITWYREYLSMNPELSESFYKKSG
jgi:nucleoside-diphosphate-sugar epimerase